MELDIKKITPNLQPTDIKRDSKIAIVYSSWHSQYIEQIRERLKKYLTEYGIENISEHDVPGSNEIPFMAAKIAKDVDGILCVGILIKGNSYHFEQISNATSCGIQIAQVNTGIPMMNIILSCYDFDQVEARITGEKSTLKYVVEGLLTLI